MSRPPHRSNSVIARIASAAVVAFALACGGAGKDAASAGPPLYAGELACVDCAGILTRVTLFPGDSFLLEETYRGTASGDKTYRSRGAWASLADATDPADPRILMLSPSRAGETRRFRMLGDTALRQLDRSGRELRSATNTLLLREP